MLMKQRQNWHPLNSTCRGGTSAKTIGARHGLESNLVNLEMKGG